ncbi:hypothetical protein EYF80_021862 [Liparis tanakae]|uniref:Uncharacterized protein n=1 Tax=Liparis tanakae TaxID=230148 RepID=A0A4Z2HSD2_9TELE|nr:hypothetical protein EYF80_021862 [Liparis tanakae]
MESMCCQRWCDNFPDWGVAMGTHVVRPGVWRRPICHATSPGNRILSGPSLQALVSVSSLRPCSPIIGTCLHFDLHRTPERNTVIASGTVVDMKHKHLAKSSEQAIGESPGNVDTHKDTSDPRDDNADD